MALVGYSRVAALLAGAALPLHLLWAAIFRLALECQST